ncbi:ATP-binding protein [Streptomyces sp. NPDC079020]|uniref:ATP-binding protein n=1 Tax=Streptomyces sp. NPDC079020 TaxID=3365722 RepID=UPI0037CFE59A
MALVGNVAESRAAHPFCWAWGLPRSTRTAPICGGFRPDVDLLGAAVATPNEVTFRLSRCHSSVPRARAVLRAKLGEWRAGQAAAADGELVLSELVTNALRVPVPGDRLVGVRIECRGRGELLRLEVSDAGAGGPAGGAAAGRAGQRRARAPARRDPGPSLGRG